MTRFGRGSSTWPCAPVSSCDVAGLGSAIQGGVDLLSLTKCLRKRLLLHSVPSRKTVTCPVSAGDSFLIAFPSPTAACAFAASVQLALLEAAWPEQLLAHPDGAELIVRVAKSNSKEQQKQSRQPNDDYLASTDVAYAPSTLNSLRRQPTANGGGLSFSVGNAPIRPTSSSRLGMASGSSPHAPGNDISAQLAHVPSSKLRHMQAYGPYRSHGPFASTSLPMATPPASGSPARRGLFETPPPSGLSPSASEPMPHIGLTVSGLSHLASGADTPVAGTSNTVPALLRAAAAVSDATTASERGSYGMGLLARQLTLPSQQQQQQHADEEISRGPVPRQSASAVSPVRCQQPQNRELLSPSLADTNHTSHHQQQQQRRQQQQAVSSPASAASSRQPTPLRIPPATSSQVALLMVTNPEAQPMVGALMNITHACAPWLMHVSFVCLWSCKLKGWGQRSVRLRLKCSPRMCATSCSCCTH